MGFDDGGIILDSENGAYYSGQTVHAKLVFDLDKVKTFRGIYAKIKGFCKVHWTTSESRQVSDGRGGHRTEYYTVTHESHEVYIDRKTYLVGGDSGEHRLHPGKHEYPFAFPLPEDCPSSFEGEYGHIRYEIKVVVDRAFKFDQEKRVVLRVIAPLDLNMDPYCDEPIEMLFEDTYCCCCFSSGICETIVKLPKGGYCPGQVIPIELSCQNKGNVVIEDITIEIEQITVYRATHNPATNYSGATIAKLKKGRIPGNTTRNWVVEMMVPTMDVYNVISCQHIDNNYCFKVKVSPENCHKATKQARIIIIGSIPLRGYQDDVPNPLQDQMPKQNMTNGEHSQTTPHFGPIVTQPMPSASSYPAPSPYPGANQPYPGANPNNDPKSGYPGANSPYPGPNAPYPDAAPPYPGGNPPYPGVAQPVSPNPPPYPGLGPVGPQSPAGAGVPYPSAPTSPFANASAPGAMPPTPDADNNKNPMGDEANNPPSYNPDFKG